MTTDSWISRALAGCLAVGSLAATAAATVICCTDTYSISTPGEEPNGPCSPGFIQICEFSYQETSPGQVRSLTSRPALCVDFTPAGFSDIMVADCDDAPGAGWHLIFSMGEECCYISDAGLATQNGPYANSGNISVYPCNGDACE